MASYSFEGLYHMKCDYCSNYWWTVSDIFFDPEKTKTVICPQCGKKQECKEIEDD